MFNFEPYIKYKANGVTYENRAIENEHYALELEINESSVKCVIKPKLSLEMLEFRLNTEKTLEKKTGARGLRSIIEKVLLPTMYDVPSDAAVESVCITADCVNDGATPIIERNPDGRRAKLSPPPKVTKPRNVG